MIGTAIAPSNLALVKYWGKRDIALNLPARDSISVTLADLTTTTTVRLIDNDQDRLWLNGKSATPGQVDKIRPVLDLVRQQAGSNKSAHVVSHNNFPTAAGLASSASGLCALAMAAATAYDLPIERERLSGVARRGSGSATRSFFGGFVRWYAGSRADGVDSVARPVETPQPWPLNLLPTVVSGEEKKTSSTDGMVPTAETSPFHQAWLDTVDRDLVALEEAIADRELERLGQIAEDNALAMHAAMISARPALIYWRPHTLEIIEAVRDSRNEGMRAWITIDAGPNVAVLVHPDDTDAMTTRLRALPCAPLVEAVGVGDGAHITDTHLPRPSEGQES